MVVTHTRIIVHYVPICLALRSIVKFDSSLILKCYLLVLIDHILILHVGI